MPQAGYWAWAASASPSLRTRRDGDRLRLWIAAAALAAALGTSMPAGAQLSPPTDPFAGSGAWASDALHGLSLADRVAQLLVTHAYGTPEGTTGEEWTRLTTLVDSLGIGGVMFFRGEATLQAEATRQLQRLALARPSGLPLLVSQDMENGPGMRLADGTVFPPAMALGATRDSTLAYRMGRAVADEARAVGVHQNYAPVADVNANAFNPIIHTRAYGDQPGLVARMAGGYLQGLQDGGLVATPKHFPGHGDTYTDSHHVLPYLPFAAGRLDRVEIAPFRRLVQAGAMAVMAGHLAVPALDADATRPASLSRPIVTERLRMGLGFRGLVVTDGLDMGGITASRAPGEAAVQALEAGVDLLLLTRAEPAAHAAILAAVHDGRLTEARIDQSVRRVLRAKEWLGLHTDGFRAPANRPLAPLRPDENPLAPLGTDEAVLAPLTTSNAAFTPHRARPLAALAAPDSALLRRHDALAREIARRSVTLLRGHDQLPLLPHHLRTDSVRLHVLVLTDRTEAEGAVFTDRLREAWRLAPGDTATLPLHVLTSTADSAAYADALAQSATTDLVVIAAFNRGGRGAAGLPEAQRRLVNALLDGQPRVVLVALGNPHLALGLSLPDTYLVAYGADAASQRAAADALLGQQPITGTLPVDVPGLFARGDGIARPQVALRPGTPEDGGFSPALRARADSLLRAAVDARVFPGAAYAIGRGPVVAAAGGVGRLTYDSTSARVTAHTPYDLASLTKAVGTTLAAMRLWEEGRLDLDAPAARYLPGFGGKGKEAVTVGQLLAHRSGLASGRLFHTDPAVLRALQQRPDAARQAVLERIYSEKLETPPGSDTQYSDLGMIVMGELIAAVTGEPLDAYLSRTLYAPLGLDATGFRRIGTRDTTAAPTETDRTFRRRTLQGEVHDETASLLGGVAGHAGLFSTAEDLARVAAMLAEGGSLYGQRFVQPETIRRFTRRTSEPGVYPVALGWMTSRPADEGFSSSGTRMGARAYGHTGFTGTSLWTDPDTGVWVVLLTNRTFPERGPTDIGRVRAALADLAALAPEAP